MATYISLIEYTNDGIKNIDESPARLDKAKELAAAHNCEIKSFYLTFGQYDAVSVFEAPDDETAAKISLTIGRGGAVSTETLKAFPEDEYREIIADLP